MTYCKERYVKNNPVIRINLLFSKMIKERLKEVAYPVAYLLDLCSV